MKKLLYHLFKEIIPIILGIWIALFINNWNEERKQKKYVTNILHTIHLELDESSADIDAKIPMQQVLIDSLNFYAQNKDITILEILEKAGGVHIPFIKTNSWIAIKNTKIELIAYDKLTTLSTIEDGKGVFDDKLGYLLNFIYSSVQDASSESKQKLAFIISDLIQTEYFIKEEIKKYQP